MPKGRWSVASLLSRKAVVCAKPRPDLNVPRELQYLVPMWPVWRTLSLLFSGGTRSIHGQVRKHGPCIPHGMAKNEKEK